MPNLDERTKKKGLIAPLFFPFSRFYCSHFGNECDTCDSKKSTSLLEGALRVCARKFNSLLLPCFLTLSLRSAIPHRHLLVLKTTNSKIKWFENILSLFRDFFTLWSNISPYTYRGAPMMRAPPFISTFTAKAKPNIFPPQSVIRP